MAKTALNDDKFHTGNKSEKVNRFHLQQKWDSIACVLALRLAA